jgi:hypothetical protein
MISRRNPDGSWDVFQPEIPKFLKNIIICGSRKYKNINLDKLVDKFEVIIRHNMLLPNNNYGKRNSTYQVFNIHVHGSYITNLTLDEWVSHYHKEFGISKDHIGSFYEYINLNTVKFKYFTDNNTGVMKAILKKHHIDYEIKENTQLRCGLGTIAECIQKGIKPYLIGFGLQKSSILNKQYTNKDANDDCHDEYSEIDLIIKLHEANLVDATFCTIKDCHNMDLDTTVLTPTKDSLSILK